MKNFVEYQIQRIQFEGKVGEKLTEANFGTNQPTKIKLRPPKIKNMKLVPSTISQIGDSSYRGISEDMQKFMKTQSGIQTT